ncbi:SDR family oxidoreductase [Kribbella sp. NPDC003505]|uniref:SDR family oxidoreductase n=1 Tax=Kribbella sp. NPDC003505 TaxID=3154448 RepID=UPI0033AE88FD
MAVLVTGATGKTGVAVVEALRSRGIATRAASRRPGVSVEGVEHVRMDWSDPTTWADALDGVDAVYLVGPYAAADNAGLVGRLLAAAPDVRRVVHLSIMGVDKLPTAIPMAQWEADIRESGRDWTILRPNWFFQNLEDGFAGPLRDHGVLEAPAGDARIGFIDTSDIGEVAAIALTEEGHGGRTYTLTGPQALTYSEALAELGQAADRELRYVALAVDEFAGRLSEGGAPDWAVVWQLALHDLIRAGEYAAVTGTVEEITGHPPRSLGTYATAYANYWRLGGLAEGGLGQA